MTKQPSPQNDSNPRTEGSGEATATFGYSLEIQTKIAAMVLFDDRDIPKTCRLIRPKYFDHPILQDLVAIMLKYIEKYGKLIPIEALIQEVTDFLTKNPNLPVLAYWDMVEAVTASGLAGDFDYVRDQVREFGMTWEYRYRVTKPLDLVTKKQDVKGAMDFLQQPYETAEEDGEALHCVRVYDVAEEEVPWLMPNRVAFDELTIWGGNPGAGKSYLSMWLAAHITAGIPWETDPGVPVKEGSVIILNTEDSVETSIRRRLRVNGADLKKCFVIDSVVLKDGQGERLFSLARDLDLLRKKIEEVGDVRLVIIDLLDSYLGLGVDSNKGTDISAILAPLKRFAKQSNIAILGVMHLNKNQQTDFLYRLLGTVKFAGIPRVVDFITKDKEKPQTRFFHVAKLNHDIIEDWEELKFAFHRENDGRIVIDLDVEVPPIAEQLGPETVEQGREKRKKNAEAVEILRNIFLGDNAPEAVRMSEVKNDHPDIYENAWGKARRELGVISFSKDGVQWWELKKKRKA